MMIAVDEEAELSWLWLNFIGPNGSDEPAEIAHEPD